MVRDRQSMSMSHEWKVKVTLSKPANNQKIYTQRPLAYIYIYQHDVISDLEKPRYPGNSSR